MPHRPTHDADFLGFGSAEIPHIEEIFRDICRIEVEDGIAFQPDTVKAAEIRKEAQAVAATFDRRRTAVPTGVPIGLSDEFISDAQKDKQWQAFLRKNALDSMPLATVVADLRDFLMPVLAAIAAGGGHDYPWRAGAGWQ